MKKIDTVIELRQMRIEDTPQNLEVDAIVNTADPTFRRGDSGSVDDAIHSKVNEINRKRNYLHKAMKTEWKKQHPEEEVIIKCKRGEIFVTEGYGMCKYIIHTVGPKNDGSEQMPKICSSSAINTLRACYKKVILEALRNPNINKIAIPIISAGTYKIDFEVAFKVGVAEVFNTLLEEKNSDPELFEYSFLEKVYFVVNSNQMYNMASEIMEGYHGYFKDEKRIVAFYTWQSQVQYLKEIQLYDSKKGYFSVAKLVRLFVVIIRFLSVYTYLKDLIGKKDWERRRQVVEHVVVWKMIFPVFALVLLQNCSEMIDVIEYLKFLMIYDLVDTVTYLLELILLADIQNPSANVIRSLMMLLFNFIEVALDITVIGYIWLKGKVEIIELLLFGLMGMELSNVEITIKYILLLCLNSGVKFFFISIAWGYFANHLRPRRFRTH